MTHHGTPLKRMGLDLRDTPGRRARGWTSTRCCAAARAGTTASPPNPFSTLVWERVYPTRLRVARGRLPAQRRARQRRRRGRAPDPRASSGSSPARRAVLYAPTHREYRAGYVPRARPRRGSPTRSGPTTWCSPALHYFYDADPHLRELHRAGRVRDVAVASRRSRSCAWRPTCSSPTTPRSCSTTPCSTARSSSTPPTGRSTARMRGTYFDLMAEPPGVVDADRATSWSRRCARGAGGDEARRARGPRSARASARSRTAARPSAWCGASGSASGARRARRASGRAMSARRRRRLVLVVGVGRSGTSLLAGHPRPARLPHPAARGQGRRHQPARLRRAALGRRLPHAACCAQRRVTVNDARPGRVGAHRRAPATTPRSYARAARLAAARSCARPTRVVVKDPRTVWFLPLWTRCAAELGVAPSFVTMLRHPAEIARRARASPTATWQTEAAAPPRGST